MKKNNWTYKVFIITFLLASIFSLLTNLFTNVNILILATIILIVIFIGIIFDMIGVATLTSEEKNFHARASKKIKGAKESISLLKNANIVTSLTNDVIGDICGIISGGLGATLSLILSQKFNINIIFVTTFIAAIISSLTVGGKAIGKNIAIKNSDSIIFMVGKLKSVLKIK